MRGDDLTSPPGRGDAGDVPGSETGETALLTSERRFRQLAETVEEVFWVVDLPTRSFTYLSPAFRKIWGRPVPESLPFSEALEMVLPEDRDRITGNLGSLLEGRPTNAEYRVRRPDGTVRWIWDRAFPVRDGAGEVTRLIGTAADVTERVVAEDALRQSEAMFRTLAETTTALIFIHREGTILYANPSAARLAGLDPGRLVGARLDSFVVPEDRDRALPRPGDRARGPAPSEPREVRVQLPDGTRRWLEYRRGTLTFESRPAVIVTAYDVTARREAERKLAEERSLLALRVRERTAELSAANLDLAQAVRMKDEFLANVSHELRTPLTAILGMSDALLEGTRGPLTERQEKALRTIEGSGQHLLALINDILDLSKIEAGKLELRPARFGVGQLCDSALAFVGQAAAARRLSVTLRAPVPGTSLVADERRVRQILVNLLSNAVKFTPEGGSIGLEVDTDRPPGTLTFTVRDSGIGISRLDRARLFQPFVQLDSRLSRSFEGTGLGLALVSRLAALHGGTVSVESEPGKGSLFSVTLPWNPQQPPPLFPPAAPPLATGRSEPLSPAPPSLVLVAEDNPDHLELVLDHLRSLGHRVRVARSGGEAVASAREEPPALILMDVQMPGMDGLEAIRTLREDPRFARVPIVAVTALAMSGDRERCLAAGADEYVTKPVKMRTLGALLARLLSRPA